MTLHSLVYISTRYNLSDQSSQDQLLEIYEQSKKTNASNAITGLMVVTPNRFIQYLEGERADVLALFERIAMDTRHHHVTLRVSSPLAGRAYADWSMKTIKIDSVGKLLYDLDHAAGDVDPYGMTNDALLGFIAKVAWHEPAFADKSTGPAKAYVDPEIVYVD